MELTENQRAKLAQRLTLPNPDRSDLGQELPLTKAALDLKCAGPRDCVTRVVAVAEALSTERLIVKVPVEAPPQSPDHAPIDVRFGARIPLETVEGPYGASVTAFSSVDELKQWDPQARPLTMEASRVAVIAATTPGSGALVINPGSKRRVDLPRSTVLSLAAGDSWLPITDDATLRAELLESARGVFPAVVAVHINPTPTSDPAQWDGAVEAVVYVDDSEGAPGPRTTRGQLASALATIAANPRLKEGASEVSIVPKPVLGT